MTNTKTTQTHRFTVTTESGGTTEFLINGTMKQARAKLSMKLMRLRTRIMPELVTGIVHHAS